MNYFEALLGFEQLTGSHIGEYLARILFDKLVDYELEHKLFCMTCDNAGNNGTMLKSLSSLL